MKQLLSITVFGILFLHWGKAQNYNFTTTTAPYAELTGANSINNGEIWDEPVYSFPVEFPFELNGHAVSTFQFNGHGSRMASATSENNVITEIFPFESYLIDRGTIGGVSLSPISYTVEGTPGSQIEKIEFNNAGSEFELELFGTLDMFVNFQCWLYEGSNTIEFHFGPSSVSSHIVFYGGLGGPQSGLADYDESDHTYMNGHFLFGPTADPFQSENPEYLVGEPAAGTVYRFTYLPPLSLAISGVNGNSFCQPNGSAQVVATGGTAPYTYTWSTGADTSSIDNLDAGIYYVTVEDADGSTATDSVTIFNAAPMTISITSTNETATGANDGTAEALVSGGWSPYTYAWSNGSITSLITGLAPGSYSVTVTDNSSCTAEQSIIINAFACPGLTLETNILYPSCFANCDGSIAITGIGQGTAPFTYLWDDGNTTPMILNLCAGDYTVTVTDANGCVITENYPIAPPQELSVNADSTNENAQNQNNGTAWAAPVGGTLPYSYLWNNGSTDSLMLNLTPGTYLVTVTDAHGCTAMDSTKVNAFCTGYTQNSIQNNNCFDTCQWSITSFIVNGGVGPFTYLWSTGDTTETSIDSLCPGQYGVTIQDTGCIYTSNFEIIQPEAIIAVVDSIIHLTDSTATAISISVVSGPPPYFFSWYGPNGFVSSEEDLAGIAPGFYTLQVFNNLGNCGEIDSIEVLDQTVGLSPAFGSKLKIYPNPANDKVYIKGIDSSTFQIQLVSTDGRIWRSWKNSSTLDVYDIQPGLYFLKISSGENSIVKPLLIQR